jgi:hypothetical protein
VVSETDTGAEIGRDEAADDMTEHQSDPRNDDLARDDDVAVAGIKRRRRRPDRTTVFMLALLAVGILLVVRGLLVGITGDDRANLPTYIESLDPVPEAVQIPNQSSVFVDLATGYTGVLVIDGIEIETVNIDELGQADIEPGQQVELPPVTRFEPGNSTLTFTPNAGALITRFAQGEHTAQVIYWRIEDGRQFARSFTWTFTVV